MYLQNKKGMTLIEIVLAIAILSIIALGLLSGFSSQLINISKGTDITDQALDAQAIMEDTIFQVKNKIQESEDPSTVTGFSEEDIEVLGDKIEMKKINLDYPHNLNKKISIYLSSELAKIEKRHPLLVENVLIDVSTDTNNSIAELSATPTLTASFSDNSSEPSFYTNLYRWWKSDPGKELSSLNFPDDYSLVSVSQDTKVLSDLTNTIGPSRYVVLTVTPVDVNGFRGDTERSSNTVLVKGKEWRVGNFPWIDKNENYDYDASDVELSIASLKSELDASVPYQNPTEPTINENITNGSLFVPMRITPANSLTPGNEHINLTSSDLIDWSIEKNINLAKDFKISNGKDIKMTAGSKGSDGSIFLYQYIEMDALGNEVIENGNSKTIDSGVSLETDGDIILKTVGKGNIELLNKIDLKANKLLLEPRGNIYINNSSIEASDDIVLDTSKNLGTMGNRSIKIISTQFKTSSTGKKIYLTSKDNISFTGGGWALDQTLVVPDGQTIVFAANSQKVKNSGSLNLGNTGKIEYTNSMESDLLRPLKLKLDKSTATKFKISTENYYRNIAYADASTGTTFNTPGLWKNIGVNNTNLDFSVRIISGNGNINDIEYIFDGNNSLSLDCKRTTELTQTKVKLDIRDKYSNNSIVGSGYFNYSVDSSGNATIEIEETPPVGYYTITFDTAGGTAISSITALEGSTINKPSDPIKPGYSFEWNKAIPSTMPGYDMLITAKWTPNKYSVDFNTQGGKPSGQTIEVTYNEPYGTFPTVTKDGFEFIGWFTSPVGGTQVFDTDKYNIADDQTLFAHWVSNKYDVAFNSNGGSPSPSAKEVTFNQKYGDLPIVSKTGYDFVGWYTEISGGTLVDSETYVTLIGDHTLYARWTGKKYTVTFDSNGGSNPNPASATVTYGNSYGNIAPNVTKNGYSLVGWYTSKTGGNAVYDYTEVTTNANHTLYAQWTNNPAFCPFVYSYDGEGFNFEHEPVSYSINKGFETTTYGSLHKLVASDSRYKLKITEELDSETFVNGFNLYAVDTKAGNGTEKIIVDIFGKPHTVKNKIAPKLFVDSMGKNWLEEVTNKGKLVTSPMKLYDEGQYVVSYEATFEKPEYLNNTGKLIISSKSTELVSSWGEWFNDVIDGKDNIWWVQEALLSSDTEGLADVLDIINLEVDLWDGSDWIKQGQVSSGSYLFEEYLVPIDFSLLNEGAEEIKIRLRSGVGVFDIDQVSIDYSNNEIMDIQRLEITEANLNGSSDVSQIISDFDNDKRVKLRKGDYIDLYYNAPDLKEGYKRGFIVEFKGYFNIVTESKENPIVDNWEDLSLEEITRLALEEQPESAETLLVLEWLYELKDSIYMQPLEYKIEKFIVDNLLPWLNEKIE